MSLTKSALVSLIFMCYLTLGGVAGKLPKLKKFLM